MELFLVSSEYRLLKNVRRVLSFEKIRFGRRNCLLIEVDIPVDISKYDAEKKEASRLLLVNRFLFSNSALKRLTKFPIDVHVLIPPDTENMNAEKMELRKMLHLVWASLFNNAREAEKFANDAWAWELQPSEIHRKS